LRHPPEDDTYPQPPADPASAGRTLFGRARGMDNGALELSVTQQRTADGTRRVLQLDNVRDPAHSSVTAYFDMIDEPDVAPPPLLDGFVVGILMYAMRIGQDIRVRGDMSSQALRNIDEFQDAWHLWRPTVYRKIGIEPDGAVEDVAVKGGSDAIAAYSGGVDSTFTLLRHANAGLGTASYPLKRTVLMVHGFDVPLAQPEQLDALKRRTAPFLDELGLERRIIRTNLKDLQLQKWEDSFMLQLVCCLHNYSHEFGYALVGSAKPYDALLFPLGSTPATDRLLSGAAMQIVHDGAAFSRTHKTELIARNPTATRCVNVCWEGTSRLSNCGICEKCVRTQLNFRAAGLADPSCFSESPDPVQLIPTIRLRSASMCCELESIVKYARTHNVNDPWVDALQQRIDRFRSEELEETYGRLEKAWTMARRGEWKRLAGKIARKITRPS